MIGDRKLTLDELYNQLEQQYEPEKTTTATTRRPTTRTRISLSSESPSQRRIFISRPYSNYDEPIVQRSSPKQQQQQSAVQPLRSSPSPQRFHNHHQQRQTHNPHFMNQHTVDEDGDIDMSAPIYEDISAITNYVNQGRENPSFYNDNYHYQNDAHFTNTMKLAPPPTVKGNSLLDSIYASDNEDDEPTGSHTTTTTKISRKKSQVSTQEVPIDESKLVPLPKLPIEIYLVVDTNFFLANLQFLDNIVKLAIRYQYIIIIPTTVIHELDSLKVSSRPVTNNQDTSFSKSSSNLTVGKLARSANNWIYKQLAESNPFVKGQLSNEIIEKDLEQDDAIHDCCLFFKNVAKGLVVLLSNDTNLCIRALKDKVLTVTFQEGLSSKVAAKMIYNEAKARLEAQGSDVEEVSTTNNSSGHNHYKSSHGELNVNENFSNHYRNTATDAKIDTISANYHMSDPNRIQTRTTSTIKLKPDLDAIPDLNPYINMDPPELYNKIFNDVSNMTISLFKHFLRSLVNSGNDDSNHATAIMHQSINGGLPVFLLLIKQFWTQWDLPLILGTKLNTDAIASSSTSEQRNILEHFSANCVQLYNRPNQPQVRLFQLIEKGITTANHYDSDDDDSNTIATPWKIAQSREYLINSKPMNLYHLKKFIKFWSTVIVKLVIAVQVNENDVCVVCQYLNYWDDVVELQVSKDIRI